MTTSDSTLDQPLPRKQFSAFWPVLIALLTLAALQTAALVGTYKQRSQIEANIAQLSKAGDDIKKIDTALGAVSRDLLVLAETNANARQVVTEFQIRQNPDAKKQP